MNLNVKTTRTTIVTITKVMATLITTRILIIITLITSIIIMTRIVTITIIIITSEKLYKNELFENVCHTLVEAM